MHVRDARRVTNRFAIYAASRLPDTFLRGARSAVPCPAGGARSAILPIVFPDKRKGFTMDRKMTKL